MPLPKDFVFSLQLAICLMTLVSLSSSNDDRKPITLKNVIEGSANIETKRQGKLFPVFQVVTFPNDVCSFGGSRNGTCYTSEECNSRGGSGSGTCASGFGVCCVFSLSCGASTSENCTYLVQAQTTSTPSPDPCEYTICKCSSNICRIRFDFSTFNIATPQVGTTAAAGTAEANSGIGDCVTDSFSITSPGALGSPVICGFNSGQHMIVDASDMCHKAVFDIGGSSVTREWDIKVTQYVCGDPQGGPEGCLQYFTGATGTIASYNFPTTSSMVGSTATHLANQLYKMCIRRESGMCAICYFPTIHASPNTVIDQNSFGLSISSAATAMGNVASSCYQDYVLIPLAQAFPAIIGTIPGGTTDRICGRLFGTVTTALNTVCSQSVPFELTFVTDGWEQSSGTTAQTNEAMISPGGIIGFSLDYTQQSC